LMRVAFSLFKQHAMFDARLAATVA
ncbi:hypothetical protein ABIC63_005735, partial [Pseudacidovorax sp. 1753]